GGSCRRASGGRGRGARRGEPAASVAPNGRWRRALFSGESRTGRGRARRIMRPMALESSRPAIRWYRSFYFRIGFSFVVFVVAVLVAQSVVFNLLLMRPRFPGRSPNALAAIVAADVASAIAQDPALDVDGYLKREYPRLPP